MINRITTALAASKARRENGEQGFTLIELLVVVLIIGILSAIAIPIFLGQQNQAKDAAVKSDLTNLKTAVISYETATNGSYPATGAPAGTLTQYGFSQSDNTVDIQIVSADATGICLAATSATDQVFYITDTSGVYQDSTDTPACGVYSFTP
jgi:type IV pilus assembly protein PilA